MKSWRKKKNGRERNGYKKKVNEIINWEKNERKNFKDEGKREKGGSENKSKRKGKMN